MHHTRASVFAYGSVTHVWRYSSPKFDNTLIIFVSGRGGREQVINNRLRRAQRESNKQEIFSENKQTNKKHVYNFSPVLRSKYFPRFLLCFHNIIKAIFQLSIPNIKGNSSSVLFGSTTISMSRCVHYVNVAQLSYHVQTLWVLV